jgi:hypothetical protein
MSNSNVVVWSQSKLINFKPYPSMHGPVVIWTDLFLFIYLFIYRILGTSPRLLTKANRQVNVITAHQVVMPPKAVSERVLKNSITPETKA